MMILYVVGSIVYGCDLGCCLFHCRSYLRNYQSSIAIIPYLLFVTDSCVCWVTLCGHQAQQNTAAELMMHLTCTALPRSKAKIYLDKAKEKGIRNILALRGDAPRGVETWEACEDGNY
jgi:hypothetical protein